MACKRAHHRPLRLALYLSGPLRSALEFALDVLEAVAPHHHQENPR